MKRNNEERRRENARRYNPGFGPDVRNIPETPGSENAASARERMISGYNTQSDRHTEAAKEEAARREAKEAERRKLRDMKLPEKTKYLREKREAERLDYWARNRGFKDYEAYERDQKERRTGYYDREKL